jgi:type VI protein secretion system component VasK
MARMSAAFYKQGPEPALTYTVRPLKSEGIENLALIIDGQTISANGPQKEVNWPGTARGVRFTWQGGSTVSDDGLWAAFRLFNEANAIEPSGAGYNLEWPLTTPVGRLKTVGTGPKARYYVEPLFFRKGSPAIRCVANVAK